MIKKVKLICWFGLLSVIFFLANATLFLGAQGEPAFTATGSMGTSRVSSHTATLLPSGEVLITGGLFLSPLDSAELYDPATGTFSPTGSMGECRTGHAATLLQNGKVLITGGFDCARTPLSSAEVYDPETGTFSPTGNMLSPLFYHSTTLLLDGTVLISGGSPAPYVDLNVGAELYDPTTGAFSWTGKLVIPHQQHTALLLPNGKVLIAAGGNWTGERILTSAELYDPTTGTFTVTGSLTIGRYAHAATLLADGKVLIAGGYNGGALSGVEIYDPETGTFSVSGSLGIGRDVHSATLLPNGKVLIVGGWNNGYLDSAEVYDPTAEVFTATASMGGLRGEHTATLLLDGKVLVAGGSGDTDTGTSAELYWDSTNVPNYTVTFIEGAGGIISGSMIQTVAEGGDTAPVLAIPNNGYTFDDWTGTGDFSSTDNPLTVNNVTADMTITAHFKMDQIDALIDVKPGDTPNSINPRSKGKIPVAIIAAFGYSADDIDPITVRFGKTGIETYASHWSLSDVNGDGQLDLLLHFPTQNTGIQCGDTKVYLTGKTGSGVSIKGEDDIHTVGCK